jgi:hypothetical protein
MMGCAQSVGGHTMGSHTTFALWQLQKFIIEIFGAELGTHNKKVSGINHHRLSYNQQLTPDN